MANKLEKEWESFFFNYPTTHRNENSCFSDYVIFALLFLELSPLPLPSKFVKFCRGEEWFLNALDGHGKEAEKWALVSLNNLKVPLLTPLLTMYYAILNEGEMSVKFCFLLAIFGMQILTNNKKYFEGSPKFFVFSVLSWSAIVQGIIYAEVKGRFLPFSFICKRM